MLRVILMAAMLLPAGLKAQQQTLSNANFCGMDNTDPPNTIPQCACQNCLNVESSVLGNSVKKRHGYTQTANLKIATSPVSGSLNLYDTSGNNIVIACQDVNCEKSINSGAFSLFVTTATPTPRYWSLAASNGIAYGANDKQDKVWVLSAGVLTYSTVIPQCKIIDFTKDRMLCANTSAGPNQVNYSKSGDPTTWTAGTNSVDPWVDSIGNPGQQITGLKNWNGNEYIFMEQSITSCAYGDQYTTSCNLISPSIGTSDPDSIVLTPEGIMFKASDNNIWLIHSDDSLENKSLRIKNLLSTASSGKNYSNTQTGMSAWQAGTQSPSGSWDTVDIPGSIFPSTIVFHDGVSTYAYNNVTSLVNTSTNDVIGSIVLLRSTFSIVNGSFALGNLSGWSAVNNSNVWNYSSSGLTGTSCGLVEANTSAAAKNNVAIGNGVGGAITTTVTLNALDQNSNIIKACNLVFSCNGAPDNQCTYTSDTCDLSASSGTITGSGFSRLLGINVPSPSTYGGIQFQFVYQVGGSTVSIETSTAAPANQMWAMAGASLSGFFVKICGTANYMASGTATSRVYNTTYPSPVWGPFFITESSDSQRTITYQTQVSANGSSFGSATSVTPGNRITSAQNQYLEWVGSLAQTIPLSTATPSISLSSFTAASTGTFVTQCINTNGMSNSYGVLTCNETLAGAGSLVLASTSTASCSTIPSGTTGVWTNVTNLSAPSISTNSATWLRFTSVLGSTTDQAQINACTLNWINGTLAPPVFGMYDPIDNAAFWSFSINQSSFNARVLKYDLNLDAFYPFDFPASSMLVYNNGLYFGGSNGGYWNQFNVTGIDNDNSQPINSYFETMDWNCGVPFQPALWQTFSMVTTNESGGTLNNTWTLDRGTTGTYSVAISTTSTIPYVRSNINLPNTSEASFANFKFGNNAANQPWEVIGYQIGCFQKPWHVLSP